MQASRDQVLANLEAIRRGIEEACASAGRSPDEVTIVAAAKTVPAEAVRWAVEAGVRSVGENYVQELREKRAALEGLGIRWHFIGTLQTSSAHKVADLADVVETLAGERAARRLAGRAARSQRRLDALIEVDFTGQRTGVRPEDIEGCVLSLSTLEGIRLRGLMTLPPLPQRAEDSRRWFRELRQMRDGLRQTHPEMLELSMGMSLDYRVAVEEGATMVRIGTALFGPRTP